MAKLESCAPCRAGSPLRVSISELVAYLYLMRCYILHAPWRFFPELGFEHRYSLPGPVFDVCEPSNWREPAW